jgi:hypothetical protein
MFYATALAYTIVKLFLPAHLILNTPHNCQVIVVLHYIKNAEYLVRINIF